MTTYYYLTNTDFIWLILLPIFERFKKKSPKSYLIKGSLKFGYEEL